MILFSLNFFLVDGDWLGTWGKHMKALCFKTVKEYQKINHFPGTFQIGRKDRLWRNLCKMQAHYGKKEFSFFPQTFVLPTDIRQLRRSWEESGPKQKWIIKPVKDDKTLCIKIHITRFCKLLAGISARHRH